MDKRQVRTGSFMYLRIETRAGVQDLVTKLRATLMLHCRSQCQRRHRKEMIVGGDLETVLVGEHAIEHHAPKQARNGPSRLLASHEEVGRHPLWL